MKRRVVITGMGAITPLGLNVDTFWNNVKNGKSGVKHIKNMDLTNQPVHIAAEIQDFNAEDYIEPKDAKRMDRFIQFGVVAADEAIKDSGFANSDIDPYRVGVMVSSAAGGFMTFEDNHKKMLEKGPTKCSPFTIPMMIVNMVSGRVAMKYGFKGLNKAVVT